MWLSSGSVIARRVIPWGGLRFAHLQGCWRNGHQRPGFGAGEIPLLLLFFYLFNEAALDLRPTSGFKVLRGPSLG
jgi:hypothetical protein